jgi:hypothetical protein
MVEGKQHRTPPALARARTLAERVSVDLRLTHDAVRAANLPYAYLARVQRARREVADLLRQIEQLRDGELNDPAAVASATSRYNARDWK